MHEEKENREIRYCEEFADRYYSYIGNSFPSTSRYW